MKLIDLFESWMTVKKKDEKKDDKKKETEKKDSWMKVKDKK